MWHCVSFRCSPRRCYAQYEATFDGAEFTPERFQKEIGEVFNDFAQRFIEYKDVHEITDFNVRYYKISLDDDPVKTFQIIVEGRVPFE